MKQKLFNTKDQIKRCDTCLYGETAQDNRVLCAVKKVSRSLMTPVGDISMTLLREYP